jgi:sterol desaturase/sphingolipid hydroxylase (fatty acid hydroxylase superfamily)
MVATQLPPPAPRDLVEPRRRRLLGPTQLLAALGIVATLAFGLSPLVGVAAIFVLVVPFEKMFPRHRQRVRRPHVGTDIAWGILQVPLGVAGVFVGAFVAIASLLWTPGLLVRPLVLALPVGARALLGVALFDLATYWVHRWSHEVPFFWRFHQIHHSTETLDWVSGFRGHPLDGALLGPPFALLLAAGFSARFTGGLAVVQIVTGIFLHANVRWRWRLLQPIVITPEFHHWHHSKEPAAHNTNYSVFLPLWDIVFGTYRVPRDRRPQVYGVSHRVPDGVLPQLLHPFRGMGRPDRLLWRAVRHPRRSIGALSRGVGGLVRGVIASTTRKTTTAT